MSNNSYNFFRLIFETDIFNKKLKSEAKSPPSSMPPASENRTNSGEMNPRDFYRTQTIFSGGSVHRQHEHCRI